MARSIVNQGVLIQKETVAGTAVTSAMKRLLAMKLTPSINIDGTQNFKASGHKVDTVVQLGDEWATWNVEGIQDYNNIGYVLGSIYGPPTTTTPVGATDARQHVWSPKPAAPDTQVTYTAQYGDASQGLQATYLSFQGLELGIERGNLSFSSSAISKAFTSIANIATAGVTDVAVAPISQRKYNVYADDTWADLGTTKLLACYSASISNGDKFVPDRPIDAAVDGYQSLLEAEDITYGGSIMLGFDSVASAMLGTMRNEAIKFFRFEVEGAEIESGQNYTLWYDIAARITSVGEIGKAPNSPAVSLPFDFSLVKDPTSGKFAEVTVINGITAY